MEECHMNRQLKMKECNYILFSTQRHRQKRTMWNATCGGTPTRHPTTARIAGNDSFGRPMSSSAAAHVRRPVPTGLEWDTTGNAIVSKIKKFIASCRICKKNKQAFNRFHFQRNLTLSPQRFHGTSSSYQQCSEWCSWFLFVPGRVAKIWQGWRTARWLDTVCVKI